MAARCRAASADEDDCRCHCHYIGGVITPLLRHYWLSVYAGVDTVAVSAPHYVITLHYDTQTLVIGYINIDIWR